MKQRELALAAEVNVNTVSRWEAGMISPPLDQLETIAGVLGITVASLFQPEGVAESAASYGQITIPLYAMGHIAGRTDAEAERIDDIDVSARQKRLADAAFVIHGSSMEPYFQNGDVVGVKRTETARDGQLVIALADQEMTFKKFGGVIDTKALLVPLNPAHEPILASELRIVGVYRWLVRESRDGKTPDSR